MAIEGLWDSDTEATADNLNASLWQRDAAASKPAAGQKGRVFVNTDTGAEKVERDTGSAWETILDADAATGTASLRTLGTGSQQAAAGDHTH